MKSKPIGLVFDKTAPSRKERIKVTYTQITKAIKNYFKPIK